MAAVATGEVEIAIRPVSELVNVPGIDFVGTVHEELPELCIFSAAIVGGSRKWMPVNVDPLPPDRKRRSRDAQKWNGTPKSR